MTWSGFVVVIFGARVLLRVFVQAQTAMNERSSRAHTLFMLTLKQVTQSHEALAAGGDEATQNTVRSQLFLADLGGSEQVKKSLVAGGRMDEHIGFVLPACLRRGEAW